MELSPYDQLPVHRTPRPLSVATNRGRPTTEQTRHGQAGTATDWISTGDERIEVEPARWWASGAHAWGLYVEHTLYQGTKQPGLIGKEYVGKVVTTAADGRAWTGAGHTELFPDGRFAPYGFPS